MSPIPDGIDWSLIGATNPVNDAHDNDNAGNDDKSNR